MGREIKRVSLDFDWPLNEVWPGFKNPFYIPHKCTACDGSGRSPEAKRLGDQWYGNAPFKPEETGSLPFKPDHPAIQALARRNGASDLKPVERIFIYGKVVSDGDLIQEEAWRLCDHFNRGWKHHLEQADVDALWAKGRLIDFNPNWREDRDNKTLPAPTAAQVNEWSLTGFGHDSINEMYCVRAKCARLGYPIECRICHGEGELWDTRAAKMLYEAWKDIEPPIGEGWQVWETVSEGSPISPVFPTAEALIEWLVREGYSRKAAEAFAEQQSVPSMVMTGGELYNDIQSLDTKPE